MAVQMPSIEVNFTQLAGTLINRSERGISILIIKDDTYEDLEFIKLKDSTELDNYKDYISEENRTYIKDTLNFAPTLTYVFRMSKEIDPEDSQGKITLNGALKKVMEVVKTGWITIVGGETSDYENLVSWVKAREKENYTYKAVVWKVNTTDSTRVVNFYNDVVDFADDRGSKSGLYYLPSLIGILASCGVQNGSTYYHCSNLDYVEEVEDNDSALSQGRFILFNDEGQVKIALGINSLTTTNGNTLTEDMKYIDIVEVMDLIKDDISNVFKETYLGNYKNKYANQMLLVGSIRAYFKDLANESVLDDEYTNICEIDADAIRNAWLGVGKSEAEDWSDDEAIKKSFKRSVFLKADIKILGTMENFIFNVELF